MVHYAALSNAQAKQFIDAEQTFLALQDAERKALDYRGGMHWKTVKGTQYLYRSLDRHGNAKSLGPRSAETEAIKTAFDNRKRELGERVDSLREAMAVHAKINAALRVGTVPNPVADICIQLGRAHLFDSSVMIVGTNAMHVYESMGGVKFESDVMSTIDIDLLWNHKSKLSLAATKEIEEAGLLGILKRADRSYEVMSNMPFRAVAKSGYMVDLIRQMPNPPWAQEQDRFFEDDLVATDIANMNWMLSAPTVTQPVVALDGRVFQMNAPDPRAFAMFKLWLSSAPDREPEKRTRDAAQARAVITLIEDRLPHLANKWSAVKAFPEDIVDRTLREVERVRERGG